MSKQPPTKAQKGSNDTPAHPVSHRRRDSTSSMYVNPDTDPTYQQDPVIRRDENADERNSQTNRRTIAGHADQNPRKCK